MLFFFSFLQASTELATFSSRTEASWPNFFPTLVARAV
jgi:hypothetical protein